MQPGDKKTFKISMLDDELDSMDDELDEIKTYLTNKYDLELDLDRHEKSLDIMRAIDQTTDIAFIDKNLSEDDNTTGIDVIGRIRDRYKLLDVFVYSRGGIGGDDMVKIHKYGIVEVAEEKSQVVDKLETLIDKNLSKWEDIVFLRGAVISRLVELEKDIDDALMEIFLPQGKRRQKRFRDFLLENSGIPLEAKKEILRKITAGTSRPFSVPDLEYVQRCRNRLAHCKRSESNPNVLVTMGGCLEIDSAEIKKIFRKAEMFSENIRSFKRDLVGSRPPASA